jgi:hypothetical protein
MQEMIYQAERLNPPERIADGNYKGFDYYVLSLGTHPCAYIDVTDTKLKNTFYADIDIECHYGLTYSREYLTTVEKKGWFIGWDYAHHSDYAGYEINFPVMYQSGGKKWTTQEIVNECKEVIDRLIKLLKEGAENEA